MGLYAVYNAVQEDVEVDLEVVHTPRNETRAAS